ncbi:MAG: kynureninase [Acidobacteria bacterium]|nr:kynureninase [Acidobacteriota bacterium]MBP7473867.1 kynureninase [Pyrinomonadaceae bacterium]MBP9109213.1 kynureninase [Pyrinomonadaceae bacterium]
MTQFENSLEFAHRMDADDGLKRFRDRFAMPLSADGNEVLYFTGNSLGLMPKTVRSYVEQELADWEKLAVEGHMNAKNPWLRYHEFLTEQMAAVVGAMPIETVVMNSLTVNLHLLMVSFFQPTSEAPFVMIEKGAFPSDQYAVESQMKCHGLDPRQFLIELAPRDGEATLGTEDIVATIEEYDGQIAMILLGGVNYYTGQAFDMQAITAAGHKAGAIVGFDLAHAAGNLHLKMHDWDVDFAVWCCYKYLNGGPGAVGGAFVHERHARKFDLCRMAGWWGHDKETRFQMGPEFKPLPGAEGWQISNPPILQMAALRASLEIFAEAGMPALRAKSEKLTGYLESLIDGIAADRIEVITPRDPGQRGCQLSIRVRGGDRSLHQKLSDRGVVSDWREPDVIRVAPTPLYNSFDDVYRFSEILKECLA